jgi:allantoinase
LPYSLAGPRRRDFLGYGSSPPAFQWQDKARVAINFAINYEEGTERSPLLGDARRDSRTWSKSSLPETERDLIQESDYEYGTRAGVWRLLRIFDKFKVSFSVFASSEALPLNPELIAWLKVADCDIVSHGTRSISRLNATAEQERADLRRSIDQVAELTGKVVRGAFPRPPLSLHSRQVMAEEGLLYDSAATNDDIPYYADVAGRPMLIVPYALDTNDARFWGGQTGPGYTNATDFFDYLRDAFDVLYEESATTGRMMSVGLHARIMRPGRVAALCRFLEYVSDFDDVWLAQRNDIAIDFAERFALAGAWNWPPRSHASV